jgi:hypothetical protein
MFGGIVVKMDNFHSFEEVLKFLFHAQEAMGDEIHKQHGFFFLHGHMCSCTCVLMLLCIL